MADLLFLFYSIKFDLLNIVFNLFKYNSYLIKKKMLHETKNKVYQDSLKKYHCTYIYFFLIICLQMIIWFQHFFVTKNYLKHKNKLLNVIA